MTAHLEFAYGPATFKQRAAELSYPMLAINVYDQATKERLFPPFSVKEIGGLRIGLVEIASNIVGKTMPPSLSEGLEFILGREELPPIIFLIGNNKKILGERTSGKLSNSLLIKTALLMGAAVGLFVL